MSAPSPEDVTRHLRALGDGDASAAERLMPHVYGDLRQVADRAFRGQRGDHTLQPTALVNEAYLRLVSAEGQDYGSRKHFLSVAAMAMRQILADHARRRSAAKRGGQLERVAFDPDSTPDDAVGDGVDLVSLDAALTKLAAVDERQARIVELRFLAGLTYDEIAELVGIGSSTVRLDWEMARAWLQREIEAQDP